MSRSLITKINGLEGLTKRNNTKRNNSRNAGNTKRNNNHNTGPAAAAAANNRKQNSNSGRPASPCSEGVVGENTAIEFAEKVVACIKAADPSITDELIFDIKNKSHLSLYNYLEGLPKGTPYKLYKPTKETEGEWDVISGTDLWRKLRREPEAKSQYRGKIWVLDPPPSKPYTELRMIAIPGGKAVGGDGKLYITFSKFALPQLQGQQGGRAGIPDKQTTYVLGLELGEAEVQARVKGGSRRRRRRQTRKRV